MGDVKRWCVTYTKHIKQKRKVYQDGFLELHSSSHKVILYDDCEKVLDSKFMKIEGDVKSGETLAFDSYLVDIGDLHGDKKSMVNENSEVKDKNIDMKPRSLHSRKVRNSTAIEDRKPNFGEKKALPNCLSPSQKVIREFKKSEVRKYSTSPSCLDMTKSCEEEWQVLYTTQLTQKAKKFHDGFLRVLTSGSQCKQAMLYDEAKRLLDSKFLKRNEIIMSGESITFDGFLVEIGEMEGNHKPPLDSKFQGRNINGGKIGVMHDQVHSQHSTPVEWDVMYTSQLSQKHKKYNSGVLRLSSCGSYQSQVTLLTEDGNMLGRRFLKLSEHVKTGVTLNLPNYLVEVGEIHTIPEEGQSGASSHKDIVSITKGFSVNNSKFSRSLSAKPLLEREAQKKSSLPEQVNLNTRSSSLNNSTLGTEVAKKSIRAAHEILSILKKPIISGRALRESASTEEIETKQSSDCAPLDVKFGPKNDFHKTLCKESSIEHIDEETITVDTNSGRHTAVELVLHESLTGTLSKIDSESVSFRENPTGETPAAAYEPPSNLSKHPSPIPHETSVEIGIQDGKEEEASGCLDMKREERSFKFAQEELQNCQEPKECHVKLVCHNESQLNAPESAGLCDTEDSFELPSFDLGF
ncbi:PREDICTED: uncharacterized protein LOC109148246 [Ipomoea nil]|uniref:uncharacterized protein LOC109148246 n=1 Tax=Ipomoea nil TaxID=35883 RepID=UPI000901B096|nr:PREDICTED: uncharacterized protein LOC109148246 [Ipomoea nil]XP_019151666.1 PREDICTED: uncharacterized protein LOC109148246 [Ipomoea nil]